ncbi:MAG: alpha/beta hydrolase [Clostridiales bacterium]|nr:alpha/beta hydrolase [Clostridiales bacterium]
MKYGIVDYEVIGEGSPVLIIHGWGIDRTTMQAAFEPVFGRLKGYKRFYIDLPGMGRSEHGDVRNSDDILGILHGFAEEVIGEPFLLVGQSYGGLLSRGFVNKYSDLVKKLILLVPCVIPGVRQGRVEPLQIVERDEELLTSLSKEDYESFTLMNVCLTRPVWERYRDQLMPALARADWEYLNSQLEGSFTFDVDDMDPVSIPTLIIAAKQDTEVGYKDQFDLIKIYPKATYCAVDRAGHNLQIEQPEIFESLVFSWLNSGRIER